MRIVRPSLAAAALAFALTIGAGTAQAQYSGAFVFGDSLSDAGQYGARFTTNPGLSVPMYLTQRYGITVTPSFFGGTDYAQGGARVNAPSPLIPSSAPNLSIADQISLQLAKGPLDPHALYQLWGGSNDLLVLAPEAAAGVITPAQLQAAVVQAATDLVAQAVRLQAAGARYLVIYNVPDIGLTPAAASENAQAAFTGLSSLFNSTLNAGIAAAHLQVVQVNTFKLLDEVIADPAGFGFTNTTLPVCTTASSLQCTPATLRDPNGALTYVFADSVHPATRTAEITAEAAASMLEGPAKIGALAEAPLGVEQTIFRAIDSRMMASTDMIRRPHGLDAWASYDYGHDDVGGPFLSGSADINDVHAGIDLPLSDRMLAGIAFGYAQDKGDFGADSGGYKLKEFSGTGYLGYGTGPWWLGATLGAGDLDYADVHRDIQLGLMNRIESGETRGWHLMGSVLGGYLFNYESWLHGPFLRVAYQKVHVDAFSERGSDSTALSYGDQQRESLVSSLGWQVTGKVGNVRPFARVTWDSEAKDSDRLVWATPVDLNGTYSVPTVKPDKSYVEYVLGASTDFGHVTGYLTGGATSGRSEGNGYTITVGLRVPL